ncbi:hypothetical protein FRC12_007506 [Ceratobasidium sp. 428]|nr:hypothetical protein FRC12_007506 [Ceratobasidium sp. 428]
MQKTHEHGIFSISDIVALICGYLESRDLVNLLTVSRPQPLMGLLLDVSWDEVSEQLGNPGQLDQQSLLRFDLYAPLVRKIDVNPTEEEKKLAWRFLLRRVPRRPLLPGLRRLALGVGCGQRYEPLEALMCTLVLLCPSLVEICGTPYYDAWIEPPLVSLLLQGLVHTAPDMERLRLLALSQKQIPYVKSSLFSNLAALRSLRILHCSTAMIDSPVMLLLGTLPELESLQVNAPAAPDGLDDPERDNGDPEDDLSLDDLILPPHSFHSLRHLNLQFLPCGVVSQLWRSTPLVRQLISVHVRFHPDDAAEGDSTMINSTICDICKGSPDTIELCLDGYDIQFIEISPAAIDCLKQLPLRRLQLLEVHLPASLGPGTGLLVTAVPNVEYLEIDKMDATFDDLVLIARHLPKLQFLVANVVLTDWPFDLEEWSITPSPSMLRLGSEFMFSNQVDGFDLDEDENMEDYVDLMAQHLHTLWPNGISCERETTGEPREDLDNECFDLLTSKLKALNPPGLELPARKIYEATWLYKHSH